MLLSIKKLVPKKVNVLGTLAFFSMVIASCLSLASNGMTDSKKEDGQAYFSEAVVDPAAPLGEDDREFDQRSKDPDYNAEAERLKDTVEAQQQDTAKKMNGQRG